MSANKTPWQVTDQYTHAGWQLECVAPGIGPAPGAQIMAPLVTRSIRPRTT